MIIILLELRGWFNLIKNINKVIQETFVKLSHLKIFQKVRI
jgi:hypothetical protein